MKKLSFNLLVLSLAFGVPAQANQVNDIETKKNKLMSTLDSLGKTTKSYIDLLTKKNVDPKKKAELKQKMKTAAKIAIPIIIVLIGAISIVGQQQFTKNKWFTFAKSIYSPLNLALRDAAYNRNDSLLKQHFGPYNPNEQSDQDKLSAVAALYYRTMSPSEAYKQWILQNAGKLPNN